MTEVLTSQPPRATGVPPLASARRAATRALLVRRLGSGWVVRAAMVLGFLVAVNFSVLIVLLRTWTATEATDVLLVRALGVLSWVAGGVLTLGLAYDAEAYDTADGITALLGQRGSGHAVIQWERGLARLRLALGVLLPPAAVLAGVVVLVARDLGSLVRHGALAVGGLAYVGVLALVLGALAHGVVALDRHRPRTVLVALVLGPQVLRWSGFAVPSIPALLAAGLEWVPWLGGWVG